jgi:hypothetical protein
VARYSLQELLSLWHREHLTVEQIIGQILQHLLAQEKQLDDLQRRLPKPPPNRPA